MRWRSSVCSPASLARFYYLRIVKIIWFDPAGEPFRPMPGELKLVLGASGLFVIFFYFVAGPLVRITGGAAATFF